jgi:L-fuconolactonase
MIRSTRIDAHQHFWRLARGDYRWLSPTLGPLWRDFEPEDLEPLLERHGIAGTIAVQAADTLAESLHLLDLGTRRDWILGVVGWVDLRSAEAVSDIETLSARGKLVGLRPMLQDLEPDWILDPGCRPALEHMQRAGLAFDALVRPRHLAALVRLVECCPKLRIVIDHAAKPDLAAGPDWPGWGRWREELGLLAEAGACVKLSGLLSEAQAGAGASQLRACVEELLELFGPERVLWGSDWPVLALRADYSRWIELTEELLRNCGPIEREAVLGGNARSFYRLP